MRLMAVSLAKINAPAPSLIWLLLPAVTAPEFSTHSSTTDQVANLLPFIHVCSD
jgi:hypothetical protein